MTQSHIWAILEFIKSMIIMEISFDVKNSSSEEEDIIPMITKFHDVGLVYWDEE